MTPHRKPPPGSRSIRPSSYRGHHLGLASSRRVCECHARGRQPQGRPRRRDPGGRRRAGQARDSPGGGALPHIAHHALEGLGAVPEGADATVPVTLIRGRLRLPLRPAGHNPDTTRRGVTSRPRPAPGPCGRPRPAPRPNSATPAPRAPGAPRSGSEWEGSQERGGRGRGRNRRRSDTRGCRSGRRHRGSIVGRPAPAPHAAALAQQRRRRRPRSGPAARAASETAARSSARGPRRLHSPGPGARALLPGRALLVSHGLATNARRESPPRPHCLSIRRIISPAEAGGGGGRRGRGRPHRRAPEPPPDPTQPPAVGETPAWAHVTRAGQPAAAPETSNAASAAQHPRRLRGRTVWGWPLQPLRPVLRASPPPPGLAGVAIRSRAPLAEDAQSSRGKCASRWGRRSEVSRAREECPAAVSR